MLWTVCNKLVRDGVLDFINESGGKEEHHIADGPELDAAIANKLIEEAKELAEAIRRYVDGETGAIDEVRMEFGDLEDVMEAARRRVGLSVATIRATRKAKTAKLGAFTKKIFLERYILGSDDQS